MGHTRVAGLIPRTTALIRERTSLLLLGFRGTQRIKIVEDELKRLQPALEFWGPALNPQRAATPRRDTSRSNAS